MKRTRTPSHRSKHLAVLHGIELLEGGLRVSHSVQRLHCVTAGPLALLVLPLGVALLDMGRVPQHDGQELGGETGGDDLPRRTPP